VADEAEKSKSDLILAELARRNESRDVAAVEEKKIKLVIFMLSGGYYAFPGEDTKEILPLMKVYFVPGSPEFILGIINVRGDIQSVLDLRHFLRIAPAARSETNRIIISERKDIRSGVLVDSVVDVVDVPESAIQKTISTLNDDVGFFVAGETEYRDKTVTLLDIGKLFEKLAPAH
jgi:purine-binding chemotaxis protein CheW